MVSRQFRVPLRSARGYIVVLSSLLGIGTVLAAPGSLDPSFRNSGLLSILIGDPASAEPFSGGGASAVVQQRDGKLVFAGFRDDHGNFDFVALRVAVDGTPDETFGSHGIASVNFGVEDYAGSVVQQTDGKLVLAGTTFAFGEPVDIALARLNADGTLDSSFGHGGKTTLGLGGSHYASDLIQQSNGKFVVLGSTTPSLGPGLIPYRFFFARFNADGTLDPTFGTGGTTVVRFDTASYPSELVQGPDGKLVAVGSVALQSGGSDVGIVRLTPDGALDPLFDGDGKRTVDVDGNYDRAYAVAVQPDNTIFVAGSTGSTDQRALLLRVNADGSVDSNFHPAIVPDIYLRSIVAQADGKLAATGERHTGRRYINRFHKIRTAFDMILVRFESDGALDTAFGTDGVATADFGERNIPPISSGVALIQQFDGRYVAVARNSIGSFGAARFDDDAEFPGFIGLAASLTDQRVSDVTASVVTYTVRRTGGMTGAVSVEYATSPGSAEPGSDFESRSGTLTWADGDASDKIVEVSIINDTLAEVDEDFSLTLSAPTGGAQLAATDTVTTIVSGDVYGIVGLERSAETIAESVGSVTFTVLRAGSASGAVSVYYATSSGSAIVDSDFTSVSGTLSWADGDTTVRTITVNLTNDSTDENDETFTVTLSNPSGSAVLGSYFRATVTIVDDDSPAPTATATASGSWLYPCQRVSR